MLPNSGARLTQCRKLTIVQTETTIKRMQKLQLYICFVNVMLETLLVPFLGHSVVNPLNKTGLFIRSSKENTV